MASGRGSMNAEDGPSLAASGEQLSQRGFFHIDIAEVRTEQGKLYLFAAIDRTSKFAFVQLVERANACAACGMQFADLPRTDPAPPQCYAVIRLIACAKPKASNID